MRWKRHQRAMRRRRQIKQQIKKHFPQLPPGGKLKFNRSCTKGTVIVRNPSNEQMADLLSTHEG